VSVPRVQAVPLSHKGQEGVLRVMRSTAYLQRAYTHFMQFKVSRTPSLSLTFPQAVLSRSSCGLHWGPLEWGKVVMCSRRLWLWARGGIH
jgi:hypothetical protein